MVSLAVCLLAVGTPGWAEEALVLGKKLVVKSPSGEESRTLIVLGKESASDVSLANAPTPVAASLRVILNGTSPSDTTYALGAPGQWQPAGSGLKYSGGDPAKLVLLKLSPSGTFTLKVKLKGNAGPANLASVPPNPGHSGGIILTVDQGSGPQVFCVAFGGAAGGTSAVDRSTIWKVLNPTAQGCPVVEAAPESGSGSPGAGGTVTTDGEADGATASDPIETSLTTPTGGSVSIVEAPVSQPSPPGFALLGQQVDISAPPATAAAPLVLVFRVDASVIPPGRDAASIELFRDGVRVAPCLGDPGFAFPDPCISERATVGDDLRLTVLSTHASTWVLGLPSCGDGNLHVGETCDPPGVQAECGGGTLCKSDCQCAAQCDCCATGLDLLELTTDVGVGTCGTVLDSAGGVFRSLDCGRLYMGGGSSSYDHVTVFPDQVKLTMSVASCDGATEVMTLAATTSAQTGSNRTCTAAGCLFGPPIPIANPGTPAVSMCGIFGVAADASGSGTCGGAAEIALPLGVSLYLTGDLLPRRCSGGSNDGGYCPTPLGANPQCPGGTCVTDPVLQPCPICNPATGYCNGGSNGMATWDPMLPNNGQTLCQPGSQVAGAPFPTSHECMPSPLVLIGTLPIGAELTTGTAQATAESISATGQGVFCGYCRDRDDTMRFGTCNGGPNFGQTCDAHSNCPTALCASAPCERDADCTQPLERCEQRNQGAFGPNGGLARTITLAGTAAGCLADGFFHSSTLVGGTCLAPTFSAIMDNALDLPAPAALSLTGDMRLRDPSPSGAFIEVTGLF